MILPGSSGAWWRCLRRPGLRRVLTTLRLSVRHRIDHRLPLVQAPVLLLRGEYDPIAPARWLRQAASLAPRAATSVVPGAAHNAVTTAGVVVARQATVFAARAATTN